MPKTKDVLSKVWLLRGTDGILSRIVCGGRITEHLPTEQPQVINRQVDMLRMLEYWVYLRREYGQPVRQCVFYIGDGPMRLVSEMVEGPLRFTFPIVNLQELDAEELLASPDWGDNLWALGARGDRLLVLDAIGKRLVTMNRAERWDALSELTAFSGIPKLDGLLESKLEQYPMLNYDLRENAVVRPLVEAGRREGRQSQLLAMLAAKFGSLPDGVGEKVRAADEAQLDEWAIRLLQSDTLDEVFR